MMEITDKELKQLAEKEACEMWGHFSTGEIHRAYFIDAYIKGFREALKQVKNNGALDDVSKKLFCGNCDKFSTCKSVVNFDSPACGIYSEEK